MFFVSLDILVINVIDCREYSPKIMNLGDFIQGPSNYILFFVVYFFLILESVRCAGQYNSTLCLYVATDL